MAEIRLTQENFEGEVMKSELPVLIDFWATWCGPCRMMAPIVEELAEEKEGVLKVAKVDVDEEPELATKFGIVSIPTLIVIKDGKVKSQKVGLQNKSQILDMLK